MTTRRERVHQALRSSSASIQSAPPWRRPLKPRAKPLNIDACVEQERLQMRELLHPEQARGLSHASKSFRGLPGNARRA